MYIDLVIIVIMTGTKGLEHSVMGRKVLIYKYYLYIGLSQELSFWISEP